MGQGTGGLRAPRPRPLCPGCARREQTQNGMCDRCRDTSALIAQCRERGLLAPAGGDRADYSTLRRIIRAAREAGVDPT